MNCKFCTQVCIKKGFNKNVQKYFCKSCNRYQQAQYLYHKCTVDDMETVSKLTCIGVGISGIASFTGISKSHVLNMIKKAASLIKLSLPNENNGEYEMDEMHSYISNKKNPVYITYAINKHNKRLVKFTVGARTKEQIQKVTSVVNSLYPKRVYTDKLNVYPGLFNSNIHKAGTYKINHIERLNLSLRTHIKRLSRKTICYSKSISMLEYVLKIYFYRREYLL